MIKRQKKGIVNNDSSLQNVLDDASIYQTIKRNSERISKLKPYINNYNWERIDFPAGRKDWTTFEPNNKATALKILFIKYNTKTITVACKSEDKNKCKKQVILLRITDGKKWHYLAVTNSSALLQGISSNHEGKFYCWNCFNSYTSKNKLKKHEENTHKAPKFLLIPRNITMTPFHTKR